MTIRVLVVTDDWALTGSVVRALCSVRTVDCCAVRLIGAPSAFQHHPPRPGKDVDAHQLSGIIAARNFDVLLSLLDSRSPEFRKIAAMSSHRKIAFAHADAHSRVFTADAVLTAARAALDQVSVDEADWKQCGSFERGDSSRRLRARLRDKAKQIALQCYPRIKKATPRPGLSIAAYHLISPAMEPYFSEQLRYFRDRYEIVGLLDGVARLLGGSRAPMLAVTFDDGFGGEGDRILRKLYRERIPATFFVPALCFDCTPQVWRWFCAVRLHLRCQVPRPTRDLALLALSLGHDVQLHGYEHISCADRPHLARSDVDRSVHAFEIHLNTKPFVVAYPYGHDPDDPNFYAFLGSRGIRVGVTTRRGTNLDVHRPYQLRREHVEADWPMRVVDYFLAGPRFLGGYEHIDDTSFIRSRVD